MATSRKKNPLKRFEELCPILSGACADSAAEEDDASKILQQSLDIFDGIMDLMMGLGCEPTNLVLFQVAREKLEASLRKSVAEAGFSPKKPVIRAALSNIQLLAQRVQHTMLLNPANELHEAIDEIDGWFIQNEQELEATVEFYKRRGVSDVRVSGEFPMKLLRSAKDQRSAPENMVLKPVRK